MKSLRARKKTKSASSVPSSKSNKSKKCMPLLDLDNFFGDADNDNDGGDDANYLMENEKKQLELLERVLTGCARCGSEKYCKIDKARNHVNLTFNQRRGWANALV